MLTYAVDPLVVIDRVPAGTTLDSWRGKALVSVIGFQFLDTQILGTPVPFHQAFEEVNIRFYVRRGIDTEHRAGVVFIREMVPRPMVGGMARLLYREPYEVVQMRSRVDPGPPPDVEYQWNVSGRWCSLAAEGEGPGTELIAGSLEEFVTVRHWGYNGERGKPTLEYQVDHPRWRIWRTSKPRAEYVGAERLCGLELAQQLKNPISPIIADGSAVTIHWRTEITG